jgi:hypothetical protein
MSLLDAHIATLGEENWGVIGSSLGGYYATYLAEKHNVNAVVINPAVEAYTLLEPLLGDNTNYHSHETFELTKQHLQELKGLEVAKIASPEKTLLLTQTGDEVLDYTKGVDYYKGAKQIVIDGGSHGFDDYADYLDIIFEHLQR